MLQLASGYVGLHPLLHSFIPALDCINIIHDPLANHFSRESIGRQKKLFHAYRCLKVNYLAVFIVGCFMPSLWLYSHKEMWSRTSRFVTCERAGIEDGRRRWSSGAELRAEVRWGEWLRFMPNSSLTAIKNTKMSFTSRVIGLWMRDSDMHMMQKPVRSAEMQKWWYPNENESHHFICVM